MLRLFLKGETVTAQRGSWALPPIGNSPAVLTLQVSPCPEGYLFCCDNYTPSRRFDWLHKAFQKNLRGVLL
jgi:hypothetical protein